MGAWKRGGELSAKSWAIIKGNRELLRFPVMGAIAAVLTGAIPLVAGLALIGLADGKAVAVVAGVILVLAGTYAGTYAVLLRTAGLVAAADAILHGGTSSYAEGMARARQVRRAVAGWALITAAVGWLLSALRGDGDSGLAMTIIRVIAAGIAAAAWALISMLVMPILVLEELGAVAALKRSASLIKSRWGTAAIGDLRVVVRAALWWTLPGVALLVAGAVLVVAVDASAAIAGGVVLCVAGVVLIIIGGVMSSAARAVFSVALYRHATDSGGIGPFSAEELESAIPPKGERRAA